MVRWQGSQQLTAPRYSGNDGLWGHDSLQYPKCFANWSATLGVRLIRVDDDAKVATMAKVEPESDDPDDSSKPDQPTDPQAGPTDEHAQPADGQMQAMPMNRLTNC